MDTDGFLCWAADAAITGAAAVVLEVGMSRVVACGF